MREDKCQHSMSDTDAWQYMYWNSQRTGTEQDAYIVPWNEKEISWKNLDLVKKLQKNIQREGWWMPLTPGHNNDKKIIRVEENNTEIDCIKNLQCHCTAGQKVEQ